MKKKNSKKNQQQNKNIQFEEMEKAEEFGVSDFLTGLGVGIAIGSAVVVLT